MLRTFDELGYRQEQRFHFELGLLKLVHLRRLLPVEQVLSSMGATAAPAKPAATPISMPKAPAAAAPAKPAFSPFEQDKNRRRYDGPQGAATALAEAPVVRVISEPPPAPMLVTRPETAAAALIAEPPPAVVEPASVPFPVAVADASALQKQAVDALRNAKQGSAADALEDSEWTLEGGELRVQTALSPTMLTITINADADKIVRGVVRGAGLRLMLLAAAVSAKPEAEKKPRAVRAGSAQSKAMEHPIVQQAQRLFDAEIQTVIDLSGKD